MGASLRHPILLPLFPPLWLIVAAAAVAAAAGRAVAAVGGLTAAVPAAAIAVGLGGVFHCSPAGTLPRILLNPGGNKRS